MIKQRRREDEKRDRALGEYLKEGPLQKRPGLVNRLFKRVTDRITGRR